MTAHFLVKAALAAASVWGVAGRTQPAATGPEAADERREAEAAGPRPASAVEAGLHFETVTLADEGPAAAVSVLYRDARLAQRPVILMLGGLDPHKPPEWSTGLLERGYMLAAFTVAHPPDPDPARRPAWLVFDERFAHSYVLGGMRAPHDAGRVIDYLITRDDVNPSKIGWLGSSSTGIPGLAVAAGEPRLAAIVAFVSTGAYEAWLDTWEPNGLWKGGPDGLWPETRALLAKHDPIRHVAGLFPTAVLMVNGGEDKVVDPASARAFAAAARPYYAKDPERFRLVIYEGFGHNLPRDVVRMYAEHWFGLYLNPTKPAPRPGEPVTSLPESVRRTQINAADHRSVVTGE
jgi:dienelactone hydrolase